jgi:predicted outer membrane lipoprotein
LINPSKWIMMYHSCHVTWTWILGGVVLDANGIVDAWWYRCEDCGQKKSAQTIVCYFVPDTLVLAEWYYFHHLRTWCCLMPKKIVALQSTNYKSSNITYVVKCNYNEKWNVKSFRKCTLKNF